MWKALKIVVKWVWVISLLVAGTTFGVMYGWAHHGLDFVGFAAGAALASSPALILQVLSAL